MTAYPRHGHPDTHFHGLVKKNRARKWRMIEEEVLREKEMERRVSEQGDSQSPIPEDGELRGLR